MFEVNHNVLYIPQEIDKYKRKEYTLKEMTNYMNQYKGLNLGSCVG